MTSSPSASNAPSLVASVVPLVLYVPFVASPVRKCATLLTNGWRPCCEPQPREGISRLAQCFDTDRRPFLVFRLVVERGISETVIEFSEGGAAPGAGVL